MGKRRSTQRKQGWSKSLLRITLRTTGCATLVVTAVLLGFAVFIESASDDGSGPWLAIAMISAFVVAGVVISIAVTHPGWITGVAAATTIVLSAVAAWVTYALMPDPSLSAFISHRSALAAAAFGLGVLGGGLLLLGEMATDGKVPPPTMRPPRRVAQVIGVVCIAAVAVGGVFAIPGVNAWTDDANSDVSAGDGPLESGGWNLDGLTGSGHAASALGTPAGLLTTDDTSAEPSVAVTMRDAITGDERWHHRRYNRQSTQTPLSSVDGGLIALAGQRRDNPDAHVVTVLDAVTGRQLADVAVGADPGTLKAVTTDLVVHVTGPEDTVLTARDFRGSVVWRVDPSTNCRITTARDAGASILVADSCRADTRTEDMATIRALDPATGKTRWTFTSEEEGIVNDGGLAVTPNTVVVDVRRDDSTSEGLFAARRYRHYLSALSLADGEIRWDRAETDLGATYASACAGSLRLAGVSMAAWGRTAITADSSPKPLDSSIGDGLVVLGECHQSGNATASFDVIGYRLEDGKRAVVGGAGLGYAPQRGHDARGWFAGLPDGRVVIAVNTSIDRNTPDCRMYSIGPQRDRERLPIPEALESTAWCQEAAVHVTPNSVAVSYRDADTGRFFTVS
ncbi:PQQ-binding-like beta-propeller repeat protein [Stackebrandtia soli]|uniref:outer membrane protein assembly factor BamB family protein n=1 Tax=Stackebrandtia soli TaxID=1892856 RepID=UPI0039E7C889